MPIRRICVQEITDVENTDAFTVTCTNPTHTPVGQANPSECNVALYNVAFTTNPVPTISYSFDSQFKYAFLQNGVTFEEFCNVFNQSRSITFDSGTTSCCGLTTSIVSASTCDPTAITTTSTSVSGPVTFAFTVNNLCAQTVICVDDTTCL
ncbi:MAG: hypothetical protein VR72_10975 [Clostridiaceae bacterium BRH_c20a]|nr:MAG: hypothetical protein VR72_10975 [Clostridiaceae bacterium BRH_c20a]